VTTDYFTSHTKKALSSNTGWYTRASLAKSVSRSVFNIHHSSGNLVQAITGLYVALSGVSMLLLGEIMEILQMSNAR